MPHLLVVIVQPLAMRTHIKQRQRKLQITQYESGTLATNAGGQRYLPFLKLGEFNDTIASKFSW